MQAEPENSYDRVLYSSHPSRLTHPDHLATLAVLFGMSPAPVESCRVLELGCGNGANLIPMALTLPGSRFTGIDLAGIAHRGRAGSGGRIGLGQHRRFISATSWTWSPASVSSTTSSRTASIPGCRPRFATSCWLFAGRVSLRDGVAFLSYNTYPGCHCGR